MSSSIVTPKIVLAHLKRRSALCQRRGQVLAILDGQLGLKQGSSEFRQQFKDAATALEVAAQMEYEFETLMMLAGCCAVPGDRKAYAAILSAATASVFKALVAGETFTHLGLPSGRAR